MEHDKKWSKTMTDDLVSYADVREALVLILGVTSNPTDVLASLDDAVSNNIDEITRALVRRIQVSFRFRAGASATVDAFRARHGDFVDFETAERVCWAHETTLSELFGADRVETSAKNVSISIDYLFAELGY